MIYDMVFSERLRDGKEVRLVYHTATSLHDQPCSCVACELGIYNEFERDKYEERTQWQKERREDCHFVGPQHCVRYEDIEHKIRAEMPPADHEHNTLAITATSKELRAESLSALMSGCTLIFDAVDACLWAYYSDGIFDLVKSWIRAFPTTPKIKDMTVLVAWPEHGKNTTSVWLWAKRFASVVEALIPHLRGKIKVGIIEEDIHDAKLKVRQETPNHRCTSMGPSQGAWFLLPLHDTQVAL